MKEDKIAKGTTKVFEKFTILILIATLFMSVAYANISDIKLDITGEIVAQIQSGIFISNISQSTSQGLIGQSVNYYSGTLLSTSLELSSSTSSYLTYAISVYNNSGIKYYFTGLTYDSDAYNNKNIEVSTSAETYVTTIEPREKVTLYLTFKNLTNSTQELDNLIRLEFDTEFIDFKIDNIKHNVPNGITWEKFVNSGYNTKGYYIENNIVYTSERKAIVKSDKAVKSTETILAEEYEYENIGITITRESAYNLEQGEEACYKVHVDIQTKDTLSYSDIWIGDSANTYRESPSSISNNKLSDGTMDYYVYFETNNLPTGRYYYVYIEDEALYTQNATYSEYIRGSSAFYLTTSSSSGNTVEGNTIGGNTIDGNTVGGNTYRFH